MCIRDRDDGGGCTDEEKVPNRAVSSKAWARSMKSQEPTVVGGAADLDGYAEMSKDDFRNLVKTRFRSTAAVSLGGSSKKVDAYIKTFAAAVAGRTHGNVATLADAIGRALVTQLGLPYDCVNYIKGSATWAGLTMLTDELCRAAYNGEALESGDQAVCRKGFKILDKTTKNSTKWRPSLTSTI